MSYYKLIFTGPSGAGKSTAIKTLSDINTVITEEKSSETTEGHKFKTTTTVALDYGAIILPGGERIHLYGTPGQERFNFMWEILTEGGIGLILLIDNARTDPLEDMRFFVKAFSQFIERTELVIGVTRMDINAKPTIADYHAKIKELGLNPPIFTVDARRKVDVSLLLQALLYSLDPGLRTTHLSR